MPITSCIGQQMFIVLRTLAYPSEIQTNLSQRGECYIAPNANIPPSAMTACM
jgi:hypothetical protein